MNTHFSPKHIPVAVIAAGGLASTACAATFTTLHHFTGDGDGASPRANVILVGDTLYGTTYGGGSSNWGTIFKLHSDGNDFTTLHSFGNGGDGAYPRAGLVADESILYGTTEIGGISNKGTIFRIDTNGNGFTTLHHFTNGIDGANPYGGLVLSGDTLFGTAYFGGSQRYGTVFKVDTNGNHFTTLHSFTYYESDGAYPAAPLVLSGDTLYGTAHSGGNWGYGTVFKLNTNGTGFVSILALSYIDTGAYPFSPLLLSGNTLYGTTSSGGGGYGTVFKVSTDGSYYRKLRVFTSGADGANPQAGLVFADNQIYGTTLYAGDGISHGTVFQFDTVSTNLTPFSFDPSEYNSQLLATNDYGGHSYAGLVMVGDSLYGTTSVCGHYGWGTVFRLHLGTSPLPIPLTFQFIDNAVVLSWTDPSFALQSASFPEGSYTNIPGANSPYTNAATGAQRYFRLRSN